jgi:hypothetical protein
LSKAPGVFLLCGGLLFAFGLHDGSKEDTRCILGPVRSLRYSKNRNEKTAREGRLTLTLEFSSESAR